MIKALIFDFDGLMLDTETPEYEALNEIYHEFGQDLSVELYGRVVGAQYNDDFEPVSYLASLTGHPVDPMPFWKKVDQRRFEIIEKTPLLPGVERLVREAKVNGLKLAIASSSQHAWVDRHLQRFGLFNLFDVICCRDDVQNVKPDPELFLLALKKLDILPTEAVVLEDSPNGVLASKRAGIPAVAIPNKVTSALRFEGESLRLDTLEGVSLKALLALVA